MTTSTVSNDSGMMKSGRILMTGANGFIGQALYNSLSAGSWYVRRVVRSYENSEDFVVQDINSGTDWQGAIEGIDCVVHLAARAHFVGDTTQDAISDYRRINVEGTVRLARAAAKNGVRHFVFLSSIKVNGERTVNSPFSEVAIPQPLDAYGVSKHEAEKALWEVSKETGLEVTILRPPLVYGPAVKANFLRLMHLVARRIPLPVASIANRRSLIYLGNLVDAITTCLNNPTAKGKTYLVSDNESVSTPELIRGISTTLGLEPRLFRFPAPLLKIGATLLGRTSEWDRLAGSLQIDNSQIRRELNWQPPYSMTEGLTETAQWYHSRFSVKSIT